MIGRLPASVRDQQPNRLPSDSRLRLALQARAQIVSKCDRALERAIAVSAPAFTGLVESRPTRVRLERRTPGETDQTQCSKTINVGRWSKLSCRSLGLLGCNVTRRAEM